MANNTPVKEMLPENNKSVQQSNENKSNTEDDDGVENEGEEMEDGEEEEESIEQSGTADKKNEQHNIHKNEENKTEEKEDDDDNEDNEEGEEKEDEEEKGSKDSTKSGGSDEGGDDDGDGEGEDVEEEEETEEKNTDSNESGESNEDGEDDEEEEEDEEKNQDKDDGDEEDEEEQNIVLNAQELVIKIDGMPFCFNVLKIRNGVTQYAVVEVNQKWLQNIKDDKLKEYYENQYTRLLEEDVGFQRKIVNELAEQFRRDHIAPGNVMCVKKFDGLFASSWNGINYNNEDKNYRRIANKMFKVIDNEKNTPQSVFNKYSLAGLRTKITHDSQEYDNFQLFHGGYWWNNKNNYYTGNRLEFRGLVYNKHYVVVDDKKKNVIMFEPNFFDDFEISEEKKEKVYKILLKVKKNNPTDIAIYQADNWQSFYFPSTTISGIEKVATDVRKLKKVKLQEEIKNIETQIDERIEKIYQKYKKRPDSSESSDTKSSSTKHSGSTETGSSSSKGSDTKSSPSGSSKSESKNDDDEGEDKEDSGEDEEEEESSEKSSSKKAVDKLKKKIKVKKEKEFTNDEISKKVSNMLEEKEEKESNNSNSKISKKSGELSSNQSKQN